MSGYSVSESGAPCGWHGTVAQFLSLAQSELLASLEARHLQVMGVPASEAQMDAWRGEYEILGAALREIAASAARLGVFDGGLETPVLVERGWRGSEAGRYCDQERFFYSTKVVSY